MDLSRAATQRLIAPGLSVAAGLFLGLALRPLWPLLDGGAWGLLGLGLVVVSWTWATDLSRAFAHTWCAFGLAHLIAFPWVIRHPDPITAGTGALAIVLIPMLIAAAWAVLWSATTGFGLVARSMVLSAGTWLVDYGLHFGPMPLPWGLPGHTLSSWTWADSMAATMGSPAVAATVVLAASLLTGRASDGALPGGLATRLGGPVILLALIIGFPDAGLTTPGAERSQSTQAAGATLKAALVQPGLDPERWDSLSDRVAYMVPLTDSLLSASNERADWVQWPETTIRSDAEIQAAHRAAERWSLPIVTGALLRNPDSTISNAVLVLYPDGLESRYDKRRLVPFVEAIPFESALASLDEGSHTRSRYRPGETTGTAALGQARVGFVICFETLFPSLATEAAASGAQALVAVTNDAWWSHPAAADAHLAFSRRRALESGLPLVQSSTSGFTGVIHPDGTVHEAIGWMRTGAALVDVPRPEHRRSWRFAPLLFVALLAAGLGLGHGLGLGRNLRSRIRVDAAP